MAHYEKGLERDRDQSAGHTSCPSYSGNPRDTRVETTSVGGVLLWHALACVCVTQGGFSCRRGMGVRRDLEIFDGVGEGKKSRWRRDRFRRGGCIADFGLGLGKVMLRSW